MAVSPSVTAVRRKRAARDADLAAPAPAPEAEEQKAPSAMLHQRFGNTIVQLALQGADTALGSAVRGAMDAEVAGVRQEGGGPLLRHGRGSPAEIIRGLPSGGRPLPEAVRERFERAFDHDFSHVRVHTGGQAGAASRDLNAHAFALGADLFFGGGEWAPGTPQGDRLLAHELTHVVQHDEGRLPTVTSEQDAVSSPSDPAEQEAYGNENRILAQLEPLAAVSADLADAGPSVSAEATHAGGHGHAPGGPVAHRDPKKDEEASTASPEGEKKPEEEGEEKKKGATYTVQEGDWLSTIAQRFTGDPQRWHELYALNKEAVGDDPDLIYPGTTLQLPEGWDKEEGDGGESPGMAPGEGEEESGDDDETTDGPGEDGPQSPEMPEVGPGEGEEQTPEGPGIEPPSGGPREPAPVEPTPPGDDLDRILDDNCEDGRTRELEDEANPILRGYNTIAQGIRESRLLNGIMQVGEGLIPIYGLYDGVRDALNTGYGQIMTMVDNGLWDPVLMTLVGAQTLVSMVGNIFAHLSWLADLAAIAAAALGVAGGTVVAPGPGTAVGGGAGLTVGGLIQGIGVVCGIVSTVCDVINVVLQGLGGTYALIQAATGGIFSDNSPEQQSAYEYMAFAQFGGMLDSGISAVLGVVGIVSANFLPKALTKGIADEVLEGMIGVTIGAASNRGGLSRTAGSTLLGAGLEMAGVDTEALTSVAHEGTLLPQDILGDLALAGAGQLTPFMDGADLREMGDITGMDLYKWLGSESGGSGADPSCQFDATDHSPSQVARLSALEGSISNALAGSGETPAAIESARQSYDGMLAQLGQAQGFVEERAAESQERQSMLQGTISGITGILGHADSMLSQLGELDGAYGQLGTGLQSAMGLGEAQISTGVGQGGGIVGQVVGAVVDAAANAAMGQLTGALGSLGGMVGGGLASLTSGTEANAGGADALTGFVSQLTAFSTHLTSGVGQYGQTAGMLQGRGGDLASAVTSGQQQLSQFDDARAVHDGDTTALQGLLARVQAERARQESANASWKAEHASEAQGEDGQT